MSAPSSRYAWRQGPTSVRLCEWMLSRETALQRDFGPNRYTEIPPHGRWQHFNVGDTDRIAPLLAEWEGSGVSKMEITRRLVDLFFVSVLLDAGAGDTWMYAEAATGRSFNRSEGIAVASLHMFLAGAFSSAGAVDPLTVDGMERRTTLFFLFPGGVFFLVAVVADSLCLSCFRFRAGRPLGRVLYRGLPGLGREPAGRRVLACGAAEQNRQLSPAAVRHCRHVGTARQCCW